MKSQASAFSLLQLESNTFDSIVPLALMFSIHRSLRGDVFGDGGKKSSVGIRRRTEMGNSSPQEQMTSFTMLRFPEMGKCIWQLQSTVQCGLNSKSAG